MLSPRAFWLAAGWCQLARHSLAAMTAVHQEIGMVYGPDPGALIPLAQPAASRPTETLIRSVTSGLVRIGTGGGSSADCFLRCVLLDREW